MLCNRPSDTAIPRKSRSATGSDSIPVSQSGQQGRAAVVPRPPRQAARASDRVRAELAGHGHAPPVAMCTFAAIVFPELLLGDFDACERHSAELVAYCADKRLEQFRVLGAIVHAHARAARQPTEENIAAIYTASAAKRQFGSRVGGSRRYASACRSLAEGRRCSERGIGAGRSVRLRRTIRRTVLACRPISARRPDRARAAGAGPCRAEACFLKAIEIARSQGARLFELRAATDLARLWRDAGSPKIPARCWSRSSPRSRAAKPREMSGTPALCSPSRSDPHAQRSDGGLAVWTVSMTVGTAARQSERGRRRVEFR